MGTKTAASHHRLPAQYDQRSIEVDSSSVPCTSGGQSGHWRGAMKITLRLPYWGAAAKPVYGLPRQVDRQ